MGDDTFLNIEYRPAVTTVRVKGEVTTVVSSLKPREKAVTATATTSLDVRADPRYLYTMNIPEQDVSKLNFSMKLDPDGRLTSSEATFDDQSGERLSAALSIGLATGSGLAPFLAAAGPVGAAAAIAGGAMAALGSYEFSGAATEGLALWGGSTAADRRALLERCNPTEPEKLPTLADLGIESLYETDRPADCHVLKEYRTALLYLTYRHAQAVREGYAEPDVTVESVVALDRLLASARREAVRAEDVYKAWLESKVSREVEQIDETFYIDEVPTTDEFLRVVADPPRANAAPRWWLTAIALRTMVTCDLQGRVAREAEPADPPDGLQSGNGLPRTVFDDGTIVYTMSSFAFITKWKLRRSVDGSNWRADQEAVERVLVAHKRGRQLVRLPLRGSDDASVNASFDLSGGITSLTLDTVGAGAARAATLSGLPASLSAAATAGTAATTPFTAASRAVALKGRIDELENRGKLKGLLNPSPDELADLKKELVEAELQARLGLANRVASDPYSVVFVSSVPIPPGG